MEQKSVLAAATSFEALEPIEPPKKLTALTIEAAGEPVAAVPVTSEVTEKSKMDTAHAEGVKEPAAAMHTVEGAPDSGVVKSVPAADQAEEAAVESPAATMHHLLQCIIQAQQAEQRNGAGQGTTTVAGDPPAAKQDCTRVLDEVPAQTQVPAHAPLPPAVQSPNTPAPQPEAPAATCAPDAVRPAGGALSDSVMSILHAWQQKQQEQQQAVQQNGAHPVPAQPRTPPMGAGAGAQGPAASVAWRASTAAPSPHSMANTAAYGEWSQEMHSVIRQLATVHARGQEATQPAASMPRTQPLSPMAVMVQPGTTPAPYASTMQPQPRQQDTTQEKNKRIQEEANMLVRSGLINRPANGALQPPPSPHRQQPHPPQARGMQLSSQSVLAHYNLHQQQQIAQQIQQRQQEHAAVLAQHLLQQQQLRQRGHVEPQAHFVHGAQAQLSESEVQFLHAAHANGTLRNMQLQHAQLPQAVRVGGLQAQQQATHATTLQAQPQQLQQPAARLPAPPQPQQQQQQQADINSILRALHIPLEARPATQPMLRHGSSGADVRESSAERIESLRRQVTAHLMGGGAGDASPGGVGASPASNSLRPEHRPTLSEQLMHDLAASMASGVSAAVPGQHAASMQVAEAARLLQQQAQQASQQQRLQVDHPGTHDGAAFQPITHAAASAPAGGVPLQDSHAVSMSTPRGAVLMAAETSGAMPLLSSLIAGAGVCLPSGGTAPGPAAQLGSSGAFAALTAQAVPDEGMAAEGGKHESETENVRTHDRAARQPSGCVGSAEQQWRTALAVHTGDLLANGEKYASGHVKVSTTDGRDSGRGTEGAVPGSGSPGGGSANENVRLLCKDRSAGADAQERVLLEPTFS